MAVIIAGGNALARAGKSATSNIPILFVIADDPVRLGFVESFKRPGGNNDRGSPGAKRMELLSEPVRKAPQFQLINPNNPAEDTVRDEQAAARAIGQRILVAEASTVREIEIAFEGIARQGADAVLVNADLFFTGQRDQLVAMAARYRLPTVYAWRDCRDWRLDELWYEPDGWLPPTGSVRRPHSHALNDMIDNQGKRLAALETTYRTACSSCFLASPRSHADLRATPAVSSRGAPDYPSTSWAR